MGAAVISFHTFSLFPLLRPASESTLSQRSETHSHTELCRNSHNTQAGAKGCSTIQKDEMAAQCEYRRLAPSPSTYFVLKGAALLSFQLVPIPFRAPGKKGGSATVRTFFPTCIDMDKGRVHASSGEQSTPQNEESSCLWLSREPYRSRGKIARSFYFLARERRAGKYSKSLVVALFECKIYYHCNSSLQTQKSQGKSGHHSCKRCNCCLRRFSQDVSRRQTLKTRNNI